MNWKGIFFISVIAYAGYQHFNRNDSSQFFANHTVDGLVEVNGYQITPLQPFEMQARILSAKSYSHDQESDLVPIDLALGWGPMADLNVTNKITITQSNRWYHWHVDTLPIARREIETHSANMHLIPATPEIAQAIQSAKEGSMIEFEGDLVEVRSVEKNWHWKSSLTRKDTGAGACELILVTSFRQL